MVSFDSILQSCKIKDSDGRPLLGAGHIEAVCRQVGHRWRDGKLPPGETVQCLMRQMAQGNASCAAVRQMHGGAFSGEAYCQARQRLPLEVLEKLNHDVSEAVMKKARQRGSECDRCQWKGHDIFINDGSSFTMSDTPELVEHFGLHSNQKAGCGLPLCHLLFQTGPGGAATRAICSPYRTGDMTDINQVQETLKPGDVVLGDRLFSNWGHLALLGQRGAFGLFKMHHSRKALFGSHQDYGPSRRFVKKLGHKDQLMEYLKPAQRPAWMSLEQFDSMPGSIQVRELQVKVKINGRRKTLTLVTTLLDRQKYPADDLVELLGQRWNIELDLRHLKTTMGLDQVRCKTVEGVKKELLAYLLVYNIVRLVMLNAAERQHVSLERISFADALAWVRHQPESAELINLLINPKRTGRIEPRVIKRRKKSFPYMSKPREKLRKELVRKARTP